MKHTIDYNDFILDSGSSNFNIKDYSSVNLTKIKNYLSSLDNSYFVYLKVDVGSKIEKVCYDYYKNTNYFDLIMMINSRDMIYDMPYQSDIIIEAIEKDIEKYRSKVFRNTFTKLSEKSYNDLENSLSNKYNSNNSKFLYIKAIRNTMIPLVLSNIRNITKDYQENIDLVNMD